MRPDDLLTEIAADVQPDAPALLRGRALCTAARFSGGGSSSALAPFLHATLAALQPQEAPHLRCAAARAVLCLCGNAPDALLAPAVPALLPAMTSLLPCPSEDGTLLVLETLNNLLPLNPAAAAAAEPWLTTLLLQLWSDGHDDNIAASAIVDVFGCLARAPGALEGLVSKLLPALAQVFALQEASAAERARETAMRAASGLCPVDEAGEEAVVEPLLPGLELLDKTILKHWPHNEPLPAASNGLLAALLRVVSAAADPEVIRVGISCLRRFVLRGALRESGPEPSAWLAAIGRLLRPTMPEEVVEHVPPLASAILQSEPAAYAAWHAELIGPLMAWLRRASMFGIKQATLVLCSQVWRGGAEWGEARRGGGEARRDGPHWDGAR